MEKQLSHNELVDSLAGQFNMGDRVVISNVAIGSRWLYGKVPVPDVMMFRKSYTKPDVTIFEVKATRQDFLSDTNKGKYRRYFDICNRVYFAIPKGLVKKSEVPEGVGLYVYSPETESWSAQVVAKRWEGKLDTIEWMSVLFSLKEYQVRMRKLQSRLITFENTELEHIARGLPSKFRDVIYKHRTAVENLEDRRRRLSELLGIKDGGWFEIIETIEELKRKEGWNAKDDVEFALEILQAFLRANPGNWKIENLLEGAEKFIKRTKGRLKDVD